MSRDAEIYQAVLRRIAEVDHGWGKPYPFQSLYVLDHAVPGIENADIPIDTDAPAGAQQFDADLRAALTTNLADLPALTFVQKSQDMYDALRKGPVKVRGGGAFIVLGPTEGDMRSATVGAMFYAGPLWARWLRYQLALSDGTWHITSREVLALS